MPICTQDTTTKVERPQRSLGRVNGEFSLFGNFIINYVFFDFFRIVANFFQNSRLFGDFPAIMQRLQKFNICANESRLECNSCFTLLIDIGRKSSE